MEIGHLLQKFVGVASDYWLTRFVFQRALGFTYLIAFLIILHQFKPLLGERGLLPVAQFVQKVRFWESPSIFFFIPRDSAFMLFGTVGFILSLFATVGISERFGWGVSALIWFLLWLIYLSYVNVGQTFYSFGWETMLLEVGFLAIFLGANNTTPNVLIIFLIRWMLFRVMFGAGLIKLRGDTCWKDLTCLLYHHETQPIPNPFSWYFHQLPVWFHKSGVLYNHFAELIVPFFFFAPAPLSLIAGGLTLFFHGFLFVSGNYAFLGFLTMVLTISTFNDSLLAKIIPLTISQTAIPPLHSLSVYGYALLVGILSIAPIRNLLSPYQAMNTSFEPLHLVNTYGAFGSVTKKRYEVAVEAAADQEISAETVWKEYIFKGKPTDVTRSPPQVAPYHLRLDWLMWFEGIYAGEQVGLGHYRYSPWFVHLLAKFLAADKYTLTLIKSAPFGDKQPGAIRATLYLYSFTSLSERQKTGAIWKREFVNTYFPPISYKSPQYHYLLSRFGWKE